MSANGTSRAQRLLPTMLVCLAALSNACSSEPLDVPARRAYPIPGCEALEPAACNVHEKACVVSRLAIAACLRETEAENPPPVTIMTEQRYVDFVNALYDGREVAGTNHFEVAMVWLGMAAPGSFAFVPLQTKDVANYFGTYRWREKDLLVIDHGRPADDEASNVALVGALIRALRDRDSDIAAWTTVVSVFDVDSNWGADGMYFGEGRFYSNRYQASLDGEDPGNFDEFARINHGIREDVAYIRAQPSPYVASNERFPHNFGARAMYLAWQRGGVDAVNALWRSKLLTHQLMASETVEGKPPTLKYHGRPRSPEQWDQNATVTALGAWGLFLSLSRSLQSEAAWSLALNWSGEQLFVYKGLSPNEAETACVWQLEMADESAASALEEALRAGDRSARIGRSGTFVTLAKASNDDALDWAFVDD